MKIRVLALTLLVTTSCRPGPADTELRSLWETCQHGETECSDAAARTLPIDESTFVDAELDPSVPDRFKPPRNGAKLRGFLNQAIYTLATAPLTPLVPEKRPDGARNPSFFPTEWRTLFKTPDSATDPRWQVFHWVWSKVGEITATTSSKNAQFVASYEALGPHALGRIELTPTLLGYADAYSKLARNITVAAAILHESTHATGYLHAPCPGSSSWACDVGLNGPHGMEILYLLAAARQMAEPPLELLGTLCTIAHDRILHPHPVLAQSFENLPHACEGPGVSNWYRDLENRIARWESL